MEPSLNRLVMEKYANHQVTGKAPYIQHCEAKEYRHIIYQCKYLSQNIYLLCIHLKTSIIFFRLMLLLFALFAMECLTQAQGIFNKDYIVTKQYISMEDGLPSREVSCAVQDKDGFMWFGTSNGLARYDGKSFKVYNLEKDGLYGNIIDYLAIDDANRLLIYYRPSVFSTLNERNVKKDKFQVFDLNSYIFKSLSAAFPDMPFKSSDIEMIGGDNPRNLFFLTSAPYKIWQYNSKNRFHFRGNLRNFDTVKVGTNANLNFFRNSIFQNDCAIVGGFGNESHYFISMDTLIPFTSRGKYDEYLSLNKDKEIQVYNSSQKIHAENCVEERFAKEKPKTPLNGAFNQINAFVGNRTAYYISMRGKCDGSFLIHIINESVYLCRDNQLILLIDKDDFKNKSAISITSFYSDKMGNMWLATSLGVYKITVKKNLFQCINITGQPLGKVSSQVRGIYVEENTSGGDEHDTAGLYASFWYSLLHQSAAKAHSASTNNDLLYAILKHHDKIYVGGTNLYTYDYKKNMLHLEESIKAGEIWSMDSLSENVILLGGTSEMYRYNVKSHKIDKINYRDKGFPQPRNVYRFVHTKKNGTGCCSRKRLVCNR